ncbi:winged helix-turn-helix domain-containing protein [Actinomadura madurae]|uniref:BTAD domain-containing putative transcriptional regulator n=1 Tax=Actinomadura madurae TaxID=1993 RepID=UPI0020273D51|nr:BTAD domain-containing putative transcriptional regulator [Actinomadura madurae]URN00535.1 winged helix-turn-helix domain-containing protein [Actinomadura madurae]
MEFRVLGSLVLVDGEREIMLTSAHQRRLLAALLLDPGCPVSAGPLVDALWGEDPPASAATTVQSYVSRLRRVLGPGLLQRSPGGYLLAAGAESTDAGRFERLAARGRSADRPADRIRLLEEALALWRGDAFTDLAHHPPGQAEAARLAELRATCREDRAAALLTLGRFAESVADLRALTVAEPLRERPWRLLMLALHRSGRQAEALAAFRAYDGILAEEGLEPSSAIRAVQATILAEPDPAPPAEPLTAARRPPRPVTPLIGREEERAFVLDLLKEHALVTITGPAGVGKSRLAAEVAAAEASARLDGARVVHLAAVADPGRVWYAVAQELGVSGQGPDRLADALAARDMILVLDGAEHVLDAVAALVTTVLARCPGVTALVTAQERTGVAGECVVPLSPLSADGADAPAVRLFTERATAVNPAFRADGPGAAAVAALCRHLDGLPLALEMAAARMGSYTPRDLLDRLDRRFALLHDVRATEPGRHRTLRAAVDWSYRLLAPAEREVFTALSVFPASFDAPAAAATRGSDPEHVRDVLARLVERSMVTAELRGGRARFALLETLRGYGRDVLAARGDLDAAQGRHAAWAADLAERADAGMRGPGEAEGTMRIDDALPDLRAAFAWASAGRHTDLVRRLTVALLGYAYHRLVLEPADWAARALETFGDDAPAALHVLAALGPLNRGDLPAAEALARTGHDLARPGAPERNMAALLMADAAGYGGHAEDVAGRAAELLTAADPHLRALGHVTAGIAAAYLGRPDAAREHATRLRPLAGRAAAPTLAAWRHYLAGEISAAGDGIAAVHDLDTAVRTARQVGNRLIEGVALVAATACRTRHGRPGAALPAVATAIGHWRRQGDWTHQWPTLRTAAILLSRLGGHRDAIVLAAAVAALGPAPYGREAGDLAALDSRARSALGPAAVAEARAAGAALGPADAALYALNAIDARSRDARPRAGVTDSG